MFSSKYQKRYCALSIYFIYISRLPTHSGNWGYFKKLLGVKDRKTQADCAHGGSRTWEMSITASQLRGRAEVKSLKPRRVEMTPFWSILRIMVPSTKNRTPYLSTVMPADKSHCMSMRENVHQFHLVYLYLLWGSRSTKWQLGTINWDEIKYSSCQGQVMQELIFHWRQRTIGASKQMKMTISIDQITAKTSAVKFLIVLLLLPQILMMRISDAHLCSLLLLWTNPI